MLPGFQPHSWQHHNNGKHDDATTVLAVLDIYHLGQTIDSYFVMLTFQRTVIFLMGMIYSTYSSSYRVGAV